MVINDNIKRLITEGKIETALKNLLNDFENSYLHEEAIILVSNFNKLQSNITKGILSSDEIRKEENRICSIVLDLLNRKASNSNPKKVPSFAKVQLIIEGNVNEFGDLKKEKLKRLLAVILDAEVDDIKILNVTSGSVIVTIELSKDNKEKLVNIFKSKSSQIDPLLTEFDVLDLNDYPFSPKQENIAPDGGNNLEFVLQKEKLYTILSINNLNLNALIAPSLKSELVILSNQGTINLILDISNVKYVDSEGLSAILTANRLWKIPRNFVLTGVVHDQVRKLIEISRLTSVLKISASVEEGIKYIIYDNFDAEVEY